MLIASCSKKNSAPAAPAIDASALFTNNCSRCHGATGVEGRAPHLAKVPLSKQQIGDIITHGKGHMPPFNDKLSTREREALSGFVLTLGK